MEIGIEKLIQQEVIQKSKSHTTTLASLPILKVGSIHHGLNQVGSIPHGLSLPGLNPPGLSPPVTMSSKALDLRGIANDTAKVLQYLSLRVFFVHNCYFFFLILTYHVLYRIFYVYDAGGEFIRTRKKDHSGNHYDDRKTELPAAHCRQQTLILDRRKVKKEMLGEGRKIDFVLASSFVSW